MIKEPTERLYVPLAEHRKDVDELESKVHVLEVDLHHSKHINKELNRLGHNVAGYAWHMDNCDTIIKSGPCSCGYVEAMNEWVSLSSPRGGRVGVDTMKLGRFDCATGLIHVLKEILVIIALPLTIAAIVLILYLVAMLTLMYLYVW